MKRVTFIKSLLALLTLPVLTGFGKKEEFDFDGYLQRHTNVSVSKVPVGSKMAIEYTSINVPEFSPRDVLALWRKTGKLLHLDVFYYDGKDLLTKPWILDYINRAVADERLRKELINLEK